MTKVFAKPQAFYETFERKGGPAPQDTHYCPGCGHGTIHKLVAEAIEDLGVNERAVLISPVGCSVFAYYYFDIGNVQAAHGRAPAVGTGIKRARPQSIVISYQGDGDLGAIGLNNIVQAANRGEHMTVVFINNAIYGMTGGQMAPTTLLGQRTTTTPRGRTVENEGFPIGMCELLAALRSPVYIERVALATPKHTMKARKAIQKALKCQVEGQGFSFVEVLSQCPTGWKMTPAQSLQWIEESLIPVFPLGVYRDRTEEAESYVPEMPRPTPARVREVVYAEAMRAARTRQPATPSGNGGKQGDMDSLRIKIAGFGGQGVLYLGETIAEAGMDDGLHVSWLPSYGPEMRGGTAHCHVTVARQPIGSPLVESATHLIAMNRPSMERFEREVVPGGFILYNSSLIEIKPTRDDVTAVPVPATQTASDLGSIKIANMVMLGALLAHAPIPTREAVLEGFAARTTGSKAHIMELNRKALLAGLEGHRSG